MAEPLYLEIHGYPPEAGTPAHDGYTRVALRNLDPRNDYIECPTANTSVAGTDYTVELPTRIYFSNDVFPPPAPPALPKHPIHVNPIDPGLVGSDGKPLTVYAPNHQIQRLQGTDEKGVTYGLVVRPSALGKTPEGATKNTFVTAGLDVYSPADGDDPSHWQNPFSIWLTYAPLYDDFSLSCRWNNEIISIDLSLQGMSRDDQGNPVGTGKLTQNLWYLGQAAGSWWHPLPAAGPIPMPLAADAIVWGAGGRTGFFGAAMSYICLEFGFGIQGSPLTALIHPSTFQNEQDFVTKMLASVTPALGQMAGELTQSTPFLRYAAQYLGFLLTTEPNNANLITVLNEAAQNLAQQQHYDFNPGHILEYLPLNSAGSSAQQARDGLWAYPTGAKAKTATRKDQPQT